ncbi:MAG: PQQ-dependent sugar dehydrogenase [Actinomycetota bacterium]|nr:PQQ-dependent sugar dehydrogenase [Actinomycetota bacterium]
MRSLRRAAAALAVGAMVATACSFEREADDLETTDTTAGTATTVAASVPDGAEAPTDTVPEPTMDPAAIPLGLEEVAELDQPIALASRPGEEDALYVAQRTGEVRRIEVSTRSSGSRRYRVDRGEVVDLSDDVGLDGERGLLGLAFSSDGRWLYLSYTDAAGTSVVTAYPAETRRDGFDEDEPRELLRLAQPYSNHNGGDIHVGPDGFLYVALGDGGDSGDPLGSGQDTTTLLGSILRIDPEGGEPYAVPQSNPFADGAGGARPEIWLYGVRNPWRFSFDRVTGDLWIGDVGQDEIEEIDLLPADEGGGAGANLGWNVMEGDQPYGEATAPPSGHVPPVHTYTHGPGCSVTGGYVYRGGAIPDLDGAYLYGDFCESVVRALVVDESGQVTADVPLAIGTGGLVSFGEDADGELYVLGTDPGTVHRIVPGGEGD